MKLDGGLRGPAWKKLENAFTWGGGGRRARRLVREFEPLLPAQGGNKVRASFKPGDSWWLVSFDRAGSRLTIEFRDANALATEHLRHYYHFSLAPLVHILSRSASPFRIIAEIGDGSPDPSDHILFSAAFDDACLVPDPDFFKSQGYAHHRRGRGEQRPWKERSSEITWRGATTGASIGGEGPFQTLGPRTNQRVALCAALNAVADTDVKIYTLVMPFDRPEDADTFAKAGLIGEPIVVDTWRDRQFAIDVDGNTNAWSNLFIRMLFGCCVLKVASPRGFRQWYYDRLIPWTHFVPVSADLNDLHKRIAWCRSNADACEEIARCGQTLADSMTFEAEMAGAVHRFNARIGNAS